MTRVAALSNLHIDLTVELVEEWVALGWVSPASDEQGLLFSEIDSARVQLICDFRLELGVDPETVPAILNLLDQLYETRTQLRMLLTAIHAQPATVRRQIANRVAADLQAAENPDQTED